MLYDAYLAAQYDPDAEQAKLRRVRAICEAFPDALAPPKEMGVSLGGLAATVLVGDAESELLLAPRYVLDAPDDAWTRMFAAWQQRCGAATAPEDFAFALTTEMIAVDLEMDAVDARVARALAWAHDDRHPQVAARYRDIYGLPLSRTVADFAALVAALGQLNRAVPSAYFEGDKGWSRGTTWLYEALGLTSGGITDWFAPGGLRRKTHDAADLYRNGVPDGCGGPLDARLDMRYRCDAPQMVTFASGDSDGEHWGLWYDSPDHAPDLCSNWARDSGETYRHEERDFMGIITERIADRREGHHEELEDVSPQLRHYVTDAMLASDVIEAHIAAIIARQRPIETACPWPTSRTHPIGNPTLRLPPQSGRLDARAPGFNDVQNRPTSRQLQAAIVQARQALARGEPAHAYGLGLYLHWRDMETLREEGAALLSDAYRALGWQAFADIHWQHVKHRDLPSVAVFSDEED